MKLCQYKWIAIFSVLILSILITLYATYKCPPEKIPYFYRDGINIGIQCKSNWKSQF